MLTEATLQSATIAAWMAEIAAAVRAQRDRLTQLDAAIGDGDHGTNMVRGFDAVEKALAGRGEELPRPGPDHVRQDAGRDGGRRERPAVGIGAAPRRPLARRRDGARRRPARRGARRGAGGDQGARRRRGRRQDHRRRARARRRRAATARSARASRCRAPWRRPPRRPRRARARPCRCRRARAAPPIWASGRSATRIPGRPPRRSSCARWNAPSRGRTDMAEQRAGRSGRLPGHGGRPRRRAGRAHRRRARTCRSRTGPRRRGSPPARCRLPPTSSRRSRARWGRRPERRRRDRGGRRADGPRPRAGGGRRARGDTRTAGRPPRRSSPPRTPTAALLAALPDELLAARADDVRSVGRRAARLAHGTPTLDARRAGGIAVAEDLGPADIAEVQGWAHGIALAAGGPTAHAAIVARSLGLPMVTGLGPDLLAIAHGATLVLDGDTGRVLVDPPEERQAAARRRDRGPGRPRGGPRSRRDRCRPSPPTGAS